MKEHDILITVFSITILILLFIAVVAITIFMAHRNKLKQEMTLTAARLNYANELRQAENEVRESVMEHLSRELHDNIGSLITQTRYKVSFIMLDDPGKEELLKPVEELLHTSGEQLRLLSRTLNKDFIIDMGFRAALEMEVERLKQLGGLNVHWSHDGAEPLLTKDQQLMAFRIFQEIMSNTLKHSAAANIYVNVEGNDKFVLDIRDDGMGFDMEQTMASGKANGLKNMMKRAALAELDYKMEAAAGKGCHTILSASEKETMQQTT